MPRKSQLATVLDVAATRPLLTEPLVRRPHLLKTYELMFQGGVEVVALDSADGSGKTTLLWQFAETRKEPCFVLFLRPSSRMAFEPSLVRYDLSNQLYWYLHGKRLPPELEVVDGVLWKLWANAARRLDRRNEVANVVVDGLGEIPPQEAAVKEVLLDLLPLGLKRFRFLISGDHEEIFGKRSSSLRCKSQAVPPFSESESAELFKEYRVDKQLIRQFHMTFQGLPGSLASVRRLLESGQDAEQLLNELPNELEQLLQYEWEQAPLESPFTTLACAQIVLVPYLMTSEALAETCDCTKEELEATLERVQFLSKDGQGKWGFLSEPFRALAEKRLSAQKEKAVEVLLKYITGMADRENSIRALPGLLVQSSNPELLIEWLTEQHVLEILDKTQSTTSLKLLTAKCVETCRDNGRDRGLVTYALQRSILLQLDETHGVEDEVKALVALGDIELATILASNAPLKTQRLRLLCRLFQSAKEREVHGLEPIAEQIRELYSALEPETMSPDLLMDIAVDLVAFDAEMALKLVKAVTSGESDDIGFEAALARASFEALRRGAPEFLKVASSAERSSPASDDGKFQEFLGAMELIHNAQDGKELLHGSKRLSGISERLYILAKWSVSNPYREDAVSVMETALNEAISATDYTPTATFFREISTPLPYVSDEDRRNSLIGLLDAQASLLEDRGSTVDVVRLVLRLAEAELKTSIDKAAKRLATLYLDILEPIEADDIRFTSLAWAVAKITVMDQDNALERREGIRSLVIDDFQKTFKKLREHSANQYEIFREGIRALAINTPALAIEVANNLNTLERRDEALRDVVFGMCRAKTTSPDWDAVENALQTISPSPERNSAIFAAVKRLAQELNAEKIMPGQALRFQPFIDEIWAPSRRAIAWARLRDAVSRSCEKDQEVCSHMEQKLRAEIECITDPFRRHRCVCQIVWSFSKDLLEFSKDIYERSKAGNERGVIATDPVDEGLYLTVDLATKAFGALCAAGHNKPEDLAALTMLVNQLPNPVSQGRALGDLGVYLWKYQPPSVLSSFVQGVVRPFQESLHTHDHVVRYSVLVCLFPCLWLENREAAYASFENIPDRVRYDSIERLTDVIVTKQPVSEPFDYAAQGIVDFRYADASSLLELCRHTRVDSSISRMLSKISESTTARSATRALTREQRRQLANQIAELSKNVFPVVERIKHNGYQLLGLAEALKVDRVVDLTWDEIIKGAKGIDNRADQVFVLANVAALLPRKRERQARQLFEESMKLAQELPALLDRVDRLNLIAEKCRDVDANRARQAVREAFEMISGRVDPYTASRERRIVDVAYRIDADLPMKLAVLVNDDPAREAYTDRVKAFIARRTLQSDLADYRRHLELNEAMDSMSLAPVVWRATGSLRAGRAAAVKLDRIRSMLATASRRSIEDAHPLLAWSISNAAIQYGETREGVVLLRDMYEGIVDGVRFFLSAVEQRQDRSYERGFVEAGWEVNNAAVIGEGEREKGIDYVKAWLEEQASESLMICDPYFGLEELEVLNLVLEKNPNLFVSVLTSRKHQIDRGLTSNLKERYRSHWKKYISDLAPPDTEIVVIGTEGSGQSPIHDRWWISEGCGLRFGTSFGSLGQKVSEIAPMNYLESERRAENLRRFLVQRQRVFQGQRLRYELFTLEG